jgi:hypothetical protein
MFSKTVMTILMSASLFAQGPPPGPGGPGGPGGRGFGGPGFGGGFGGPPQATITGAPYSAIQTFQSQQTLANGNEIQRSDQGKVYRDSQGRVRTETTRDSHTMITIFDPVAGYIIRLDPQNSTAVKSALPTGAPPTPPTPPAGSTAPQIQTEDLGSKTINGLTATGKRTLITIPAGTFGNAQAIQSTREVWTSTDLQVQVLATTSDPRFGTSTSQLTSVARAEPDASLFQVPSTYTVTTHARRGPPPDQE